MRRTHAEGRALVASSLWLHAGFAGASALAGGMLALVGGAAPWPLALGACVGGGALAVVASQRARTTIDAGAEMAGRSAQPDTRPLHGALAAPRSAMPRP